MKKLLSFLKNQKGEIATALTILSLGLMVLGALVGTAVVKRGGRLPGAATGGVDHWVITTAEGTPTDATRQEFRFHGETYRITPRQTGCEDVIAFVRCQDGFECYLEYERSSNDDKTEVCAGGQQYDSYNPWSFGGMITTMDYDKWESDGFPTATVEVCLTIVPGGIDACKTVTLEGPTGPTSTPTPVATTTPTATATPTPTEAAVDKPDLKVDVHSLNPVNPKDDDDATVSITVSELQGVAIDQNFQLYVDVRWVGYGQRCFKEVEFDSFGANSSWTKIFGPSTAGVPETYQLNCLSSAGLAEGDWQIWAKVDNRGGTNGEIDETNETNNTDQLDFHVSVAPAPTATITPTPTSTPQPTQTPTPTPTQTPEGGEIRQIDWRINPCHPGGQCWETVCYLAWGVDDCGIADNLNMDDGASSYNLTCTTSDHSITITNNDTSGHKLACETYRGCRCDGKCKEQQKCQTNISDDDCDQNAQETGRYDDVLSPGSSVTCSLGGASPPEVTPQTVDQNGDGFIDFRDREIIRVNFGQTVAAGTNGDTNSDGFVNAQDFSNWAIFALQEV